MYPADVPEGSFIIRAHTPMSNLFSCLWFNEVDRFTSRDQLSFAYTYLKLTRMNPDKPFHLNMFKVILHLHMSTSKIIQASVVVISSTSVTSQIMLVFWEHKCSLCIDIHSERIRSKSVSWDIYKCLNYSWQSRVLLKKWSSSGLKKLFNSYMPGGMRLKFIEGSHNHGLSE
ncbi:hypothetical protein Goklo_008938 [Gossypium klotzschianum]|uniref:TOD1/MUCI70 glycosyltransferase-like domain-containing protein n=1 Tax=Gossypium klotzschianum TaxID=34286 RepID=A0A7J8V1C1_9ROSI|nr:hypothetical protein [Gossypium klotzschianum]